MSEQVYTFKLIVIGPAGVHEVVIIGVGSSVSTSSQPGRVASR